MSFRCALDCCCPSVGDAGPDRSERTQEEFLSLPTLPQEGTTLEQVSDSLEKDSDAIETPDNNIPEQEEFLIPPTFPPECDTLEQVNDSLAKDSTRLSFFYDVDVMDAIKMSKIVERVQGLEGLSDIRVRWPLTDREKEDKPHSTTFLTALITGRDTLRHVAIDLGRRFHRSYASALSLQTNLEYLDIICSVLLPCELGSLLSSGQWQGLRYLSLDVREGDFLNPTPWQLPSLETLKLTYRDFTGDFNLKHFLKLKDVLISTLGRVTVCFGGSLKRLVLRGNVVVDGCLPQLAFLHMSSHPDPVSLFVRHQKTVRELAICGDYNGPYSHLNSVAIDGSVLRFLSLDRLSIGSLHWTSEIPLKALQLFHVIFKDTPVLRATSIYLGSSDASFFRAFSENPALLIGPTGIGLGCYGSLPRGTIEKIITPFAGNLVFFATHAPFASLPKLPRLKYLGLDRYADLLTAKPSIEMAGKLQVLGVFHPEPTLGEAVRRLLPKVCRTLAVQKLNVPVVEGCAVDARPFFTPNGFWLECLDFKPEITRR